MAGGDLQDVLAEKLMYLTCCKSAALFVVSQQPVFPEAYKCEHFVSPHLEYDLDPGQTLESGIFHPDPFVIFLVIL